jgi:hypothetical protein
MERKELLQCFWECKLVATVENSKEGPQKLKVELPYDPAVLLLNIYLKEMKSITSLPILQHYSK